MEFPIINLEKLNGDERTATMAKMKDAYENWGFLGIHLYHQHEEMILFDHQNHDFFYFK